MKKKRKKNSHKKKNNSAFQTQVFLVSGVLMAVVFLPTTFLLSVGMLPSFVALIADRSRRKTKAITVGAMNLAGAMPFILELWVQGHSFEKAFTIITDLKAMVVIYAAAGIGYVIDWAVTGIVASVLLQRGHARKKAIKKRQKDLIERWGKEVTGEVPMDQYGFEVKAAPAADKKAE